MPDILSMPHKSLHNPIDHAPENISAAARPYGQEAIKALLHLARHAEKENIRLSAWKILLERGFGHVITPNTIPSTPTPPTLILVPYQVDRTANIDHALDTD